MRKAVLILVVLLIAAVFWMYVLDKGSDFEAVYPDENLIITASKPASENTVQTTEPSPAQTPDLPDTSATASAEWELVWSDDFNGPYLDLERWTEVDRRDNFNNELQYYAPANSNIEDGCLYLTAKREQKESKNYTSAMVQSMNKCAILYGRIEARMKVPLGRGLFPAFWLLTYEGNNEIDIMEMIGDEPDLFYGVVHYHKGDLRQKEADLIKIHDPDEFHVFALEWDPTELKWYVDGQLFFRSDRGVPTKEMYIVFTLAVGGDWPDDPDDTTIFPCSFIIDYVRYYRHRT